MTLYRIPILILGENCVSPEIETLRITLKKIETTLWQKRVEEVRRSQLLALLRKYLLILCGLGAVLFIFSTKIDVIKIIAQILV